jgi:colicin import membrane protein
LLKSKKLEIDKLQEALTDARIMARDSEEQELAIQAKLEAQVDACNSEIEALTMEKDLAESTTVRLESELEALRAEYAERERSDAEAAEDARSDLETQLALAQDELQKVLETKGDEVNNLQDALEEARAQILSMEEAKRQMEALLEATKESLEAATAAAEDADASAKALEESSANHHAMKDARIQELESELSDSTSSVMQLKSAQAQLEAKVQEEALNAREKVAHLTLQLETQERAAAASSAAAVAAAQSTTREQSAVYEAKIATLQAKLTLMKDEVNLRLYPRWHFITI